MSQGFTLIELLIVIAIIGILSSAVLVNVSSSREKARMTKVLSSMRSLSVMVNSCLVSGGSLNHPVSNGNPGSAICNISPEILPDISSTNFIYCAQGCGGWYDATNGSYAISAYSDSYSSGRKVVVCGSNVNMNGWYGVGDWNFTGITACKTYGF